MTEEPQPTTIQDFLDLGRPFEVKFEDGKTSIAEARGISKISLSSEEIKNAKIRKAAKRKVLKEHKQLITAAADILISAKVPFKVTFGTDESVIRFDLDHYIRLFRDKEDRNPNKCLAMGFNSLDEKPIALIRECLSIYPSIKLLTSKR